MKRIDLNDLRVGDTVIIAGLAYTVEKVGPTPPRFPSVPPRLTLRHPNPPRPAFRTCSYHAFQLEFFRAEALRAVETDQEAP